MSIVQFNPTFSNVSAVTVMQTISCYIPNTDTAQSLATIQREARTHNVQAHSLTLMYRGRARTIVHTARMLIFGFKVGARWLQVWWALTGKPNTFPIYRPLVGGSTPMNDSLYQSEIEGPQITALSATIFTVDDVSPQSCSTRPNAATNKYALEIYQPAMITESSSYYPGSQMLAIFSVCVLTLALITGIRSLPLKSKIKTRSDVSEPMVAETDEELEYIARPSTLTQSVDGDSEDSEGGGVRLSTSVEEEIPISENRPVHAHPSGDTVTLPSILRGGRRNVSVHWHREHAREVKEHERYEKRKRMAKDWRLRAVD